MASPPAARPPTILIIDDEAAVARALQAYLQSTLRNVRVLAESDPQNALTRLAEDDVQLVIADQIMDGLTGTEFLARIKRTAPKTIRILVTAFPDSVLDPLDLKLAEPLHVFLKPLQTEPFLELLRTLLHLQEAGGANSLQS